LIAGLDSKAQIFNVNDMSKLETRIRPNLEKGSWVPGSSHKCYFTFEDGYVQMFDTRNFKTPYAEF